MLPIATPYVASERCKPAQRAELAACPTVCQVLQGAEGDLANAEGVCQVFTNSLAWDKSAKARLS